MRFPSWTAARSDFSRWTWTALITILLVSVYTDISRYETVTGEKYIPSYFPPGQADFTYLYVGASALISGQNPYTTPLPQFHPPFHRPVVVDNTWYYQIYPPTLLLLYAPVAWYFGGDRFSASQFVFRMNLVILL